MTKPAPLLRTTVPLAVIASVACGTLIAQARADNRHPDYSAADVHFMSGMIYHHAQAVRIAGWAPTHDASPSLRALCERIVVGQRDEIFPSGDKGPITHRDVPPAHIEGHHGHLVQGERARLIETDDLHGAQRLHCLKTADKDMRLLHVADAKGQDRRGNRRQSLRHGGNGESNGRFEHLEQRRETMTFL